MKKFVMFFLVGFTSIVGYAQNYVIESSFKPFSMEELMIAARANAVRQQRMQESFEEYREKAYYYFNKGDYKGFIYYSDYALSTGWYNNKLYYDRGIAFEKLHDYSKAKKEYKKAIKKGYYPAQEAYEQCKVHHKAWKKSH